jgi:hypothetical protein
MRAITSLMRRALAKDGPHLRTRLFQALANNMKTSRCFVMAGLVPAIHVFLAQMSQDVDARKAGHDELRRKRPFR